MPTGVLLGVATAISWGSADFFARFASRAVGPMRALLGMQAWGAVLVSVLLLFARDWGHLFDGSGWQPWAWGGLAGVINTLAMFALYRSFEIGKMAVVAPISASYPALTVMLSMFSGERLSLYRWIGIIVALVGVLLVAGGENGGPESGVTASAVAAPRGKTLFGQPPRALDGVLWALAAAVGFGVLFWLLGVRIIPGTGAMAAVWLIRITGAALTLCIVVAQRIPLRVRSRRVGAQLYSMGFFDTAAFALSNLGMRIEQVAVVSVLGSLYGAVTVALAAIFLKERITTPQWAGIGAIFAGVALMNL